jgi:hypothetical protein
MAIKKTKIPIPAEAGIDRAPMGVILKPPALREKPHFTLFGYRTKA